MPTNWLSVGRDIFVFSPEYLQTENCMRRIWTYFDAPVAILRKDSVTDRGEWGIIAMFDHRDAAFGARSLLKVLSTDQWTRLVNQLSLLKIILKKKLCRFAPPSKGKGKTAKQKTIVVNKESCWAKARFLPMPLRPTLGSLRRILGPVWNCFPVTAARNGSNQNCGNTLTDIPTTRMALGHFSNYSFAECIDGSRKHIARLSAMKQGVAAPPGGKSSICLGWDDRQGFSRLDFCWLWYGHVFLFFHL